MSLDATLARIDADLPAALDRLMALLRIPSISTDPAYADKCQQAADWLVEDLQSLGIALLIAVFTTGLGLLMLEPVQLAEHVRLSILLFFAVFVSAVGAWLREGRR